MSEVIKRDKQLRLLSQLYARIKRDQETATPALLTVWREQLSADWNAFKTLHHAVIERAGASEIEEQLAKFDEACTFQYKANVLLAECREKMKLKLKNAAAATLRQAELRYTTTLRRLQTMCEQIVNGEAQIQVVQIDSQRAVIDKLYGAYQEAALQFIANGASQDDILAGEGEINARYLDASGTLTRIQQQHDSSPVAAINVRDALLLPHLNIPPFDGKLETWEAFRESFSHGIHERTNLPAVHKLQYLKSVLCGEPEELVRNFTLTAANYVSAWTLLNERYNNRRELIAAHLRVLTTLAPCDAFADDLRTLSNKASSACLALGNLNRPVDQWDDWVVFHVCEKLDRESRNLWEQKLDGDELPTWRQLDEFLQGRIRALSSIGSVKSVRHLNRQQATTHSKVRAHQTSSQTQHVYTSQSSGQHHTCPCCNEGHMLMFCNQFRQLSPNDRRAMAAEKALCFICLATDHVARQCNSTRSCNMCNAKHHTLLHNSEQIRSNRAALAVNAAHQQRPPVMLATALVNVRDNAGQIHPVRASTRSKHNSIRSKPHSHASRED